jgi:hypothetical protein
MRNTLVGFLKGNFKLVNSLLLNGLQLSKNGSGK